MGSSLNSFVSPRLAESFGKDHYMNVAGPIFIGAALMIVSLALAVGKLLSTQFSPSSTAKVIWKKKLITRATSLLLRGVALHDKIFCRRRVSEATAI
jgi:hypothetical protein